MRRLWLFTIALPAILIARKLGIPFSGSLLTFAALLLAFSVIQTRFLASSIIVRISLALFILLSIALLQYWIQLFAWSYILTIAWLLFSPIALKDFRNTLPGIIIWLMVSFIFISSVLLNPRHFHNFYRNSTYEQFIRARYTETNGIIADLFIDRYKSPDSIKAEFYYKLALKAEADGDYSKEIRLLNRSIDYNPDDAFAYHKRGIVKLHYLDLNYDVAYSAIKDFSRAIRLKPDFTLAYFHRAVALGYVHNYQRSFLDTRFVWYADSTLSESDFISKYGKSKKAFSKPFHP